MVNVVFMGTPEFSVATLQALIDTKNVVGVVTQPDRPAGRGRQLRPSPVKQLASEEDIPVYQPKSLRSDEAATPLREWDPDVIVVAAFGQILRPHVLDLPPLGCLNVHASLLPRWRGASPIQHAIIAGDETTGITLMKMDEGMDTGPLYVSEAIDIGPEDTAATLHDRLADLGGAMIGCYLDAILAGDLEAKPQEDSLATYAPLIKKENGWLNWSDTPQKLDRQIRAMTPWPGAFTTWQGTNLKILKAAPVPVTDFAGNPGEVVVCNDQLFIGAQEGLLRLERLQLAGKKALAAKEFLRGRPDFAGALLGE